MLNALPIVNCDKEDRTVTSFGEKHEKKYPAMGASALMISAFGATASFAQEETVQEEQIVVTGTRRNARSAADTPAPVDVITRMTLLTMAQQK